MSSDEEKRLEGLICNGYGVCQNCETHYWRKKSKECKCGAANTCKKEIELMQLRYKKKVGMCSNCNQRGLYAMDNRFDCIYGSEKL